MGAKSLLSVVAGMVVAVSGCALSDDGGTSRAGVEANEEPSILSRVLNSATVSSTGAALFPDCPKKDHEEKFNICYEVANTSARYFNEQRDLASIPLKRFAYSDMDWDGGQKTEKYGWDCRGSAHAPTERIDEGSKWKGSARACAHNHHAVQGLISYKADLADSVLAGDGFTMTGGLGDWIPHDKETYVDEFGNKIDGRNYERTFFGCSSGTYILCDPKERILQEKKKNNWYMGYEAHTSPYIVAIDNGLDGALVRTTNGAPSNLIFEDKSITRFEIDDDTIVDDGSLIPARVNDVTPSPPVPPPAAKSQQGESGGATRLELPGYRAVSGLASYGATYQVIGGKFDGSTVVVNASTGEDNEDTSSCSVFTPTSTDFSCDIESSKNKVWDSLNWVWFRVGIGTQKSDDDEVNTKALDFRSTHDTGGLNSAVSTVEASNCGPQNGLWGTAPFPRWRSDNGYVLPVVCSTVRNAGGVAFAGPSQLGEAVKAPVELTGADVYRWSFPDTVSKGGSFLTGDSRRASSEGNLVGTKGTCSNWSCYDGRDEVREFGLAAELGGTALDGDRFKINLGADFDKAGCSTASEYITCEQTSKVLFGNNAVDRGGKNINWKKDTWMHTSWLANYTWGVWPTTFRVLNYTDSQLVADRAAETNRYRTESSAIENEQKVAPYSHCGDDSADCGPGVASIGGYRDAKEESTFALAYKLVDGDHDGDRLTIDAKLAPGDDIIPDNVEPEPEPDPESPTPDPEPTEEPVPDDPQTWCYTSHSAATKLKCKVMVSGGLLKTVTVALYAHD